MAVIYLDSAATTLEKPPAVVRAVAGAMRTMTSPGRGSHSAADAAAATVFACREEAAALFGMDDPADVVFTFNATHGLNIAIKSIVKPGSTVLISGYEHNAVLRPLCAMEGVNIRVADGPLFSPEKMLFRMEQLLTPEVSCVICTHMSNVFGYILPIDEIAVLCRRKSVPLIVDASQSAGSVPVDAGRWQAAFVAMPGHKGLYGPQGTGLLLCRYRSEPLLEGGTGSESRRREMPEYLPDRLEAGTHNVPGIAGLLEGLRFVRRRGVEQIGRQEDRLIRAMAKGLSGIRGVQVYEQGKGGRCRGGVLSFRVDGRDCEELGHELARRGFALRSGLHCAPLAHETAGTADTGTVRASVSAFTTPQQVEKFVETVSRLA